MSMLWIDDMEEKRQGTATKNTSSKGSWFSICTWRWSWCCGSRRPRSSSLSHLTLLTSALQLQLCSAGRLGLPEQQRVGVLQRPHHLLGAQPHTHNRTAAITRTCLLIKLEARLERVCVCEYFSNSDHKLSLLPAFLVLKLHFPPWRFSPF